MTIRHIVSWRLATEDAQERDAQAAEVARRLVALDGQVPGMLAITAGANTVLPGSNWDVALVADFDSVEALDGYQKHPAHLEAAGYIRSVAADRVAVDFEL